MDDNEPRVEIREPVVAAATDSPLAFDMEVQGVEHDAQGSAIMLKFTFGNLHQDILLRWEQALWLTDNIVRMADECKQREEIAKVATKAAAVGNPPDA